MNYYLSDLHLFHNKVLKLSNRPFSTIEEMHETIIKNWKAKVKETDVVYILGDVAMYHEKEAADILNDLPGKKVLITGNHDRFNLRNPKFKKCFAEVTPFKEVNEGRRKVVLFHYPIEEWDGYFRGFYHLHGHVHEQDAKLTKQPKRYNVSVDVLDYTPCSLDEIIERNKEKDND